MSGHGLVARLAARERSLFAVLTVLALLIPAVMGIMYVQARKSPDITAYVIPNEAFVHEIGNGYVARLPRVVFDEDASTLLEDGRRLAAMVKQHEAVRTQGEGRHSFLEGHILLSASDNSDPRSNGRVYEVRLLKKLWFEDYRNLKRVLVPLCVVLALLVAWSGRVLPWAGPALGGYMVSVAVALPIFLGVTWFSIGVTGNSASILDDSMWNSVIVEPDSGSYMGWYEVRTPGYPLFLRALVEPTPEALGLSTASAFQVPPDSHPFIIVTRAQIVLFLAALFVTGVLLSVAGGGVLPLALSYAMLAHGGVAASYLQRVMSEGLHLPLMVLFVGVVVLAGCRQGRFLNCLAGLLFFLCLLVMPRFLGGAPLLAIPLAASLVQTRSVRGVLRSGAWLSPAIFLVLYVGYCTWGYSRFGAFAMAPTNGYSSVGIALAMAKHGDEKFMPRPEEREFVAFAIERAKASPVAYPDPNYVNANIAIAFQTCAEKGPSVLPGGKQNIFAECNALWARANSTLLKANRVDFLRHLGRIFRDVDAFSPLVGNWVWIGLAVLAAAHGVWRRSALSAAAALIMITHLFNVLFTGALQDVVDRYTATTSWLPALGLGAFLSGLWQEAAGRGRERAARRTKGGG